MGDVLFIPANIHEKQLPSFYIFVFQQRIKKGQNVIRSIAEANFVQLKY